MLPDIFIFLFYSIFFGFLIVKIPFFKNSGLSGKWLIFLFFIKVAAGAFYAWFYLQPGRYETSDTWNYFNLSLEETDWLLHDPAGFFKDLFQYGYSQSGGLFAGENSYWNDLKANMIIKLLAICNIFSFKNYFANILFFNFLFFFGPCALFRLVWQKLKFKSPQIVIVAVIFLIPSFLFWCSGIHKDGLIFSCLCLILYLVHAVLEKQSSKTGNIILIMLFFLLLFSLRNFMAILLIPAIVVWLLLLKFPKRGLLITAAVYLTGISLFFLSPKIHLPDFPAFIVEKQNEFKQLEGNSQIEVPALENNLKSFIQFLPAAIDIGFLRPHPNEMENKSYLPAIAENFLLAMVFLFFLFKRLQLHNEKQIAFNWFCVCFAVSFLLIAGYTVTFSGAIVRYRSVVLPLLFLPVITNISFNEKWFRISKS